MGWIDCEQRRSQQIHNHSVAVDLNNHGVRLYNRGDFAKADHFFLQALSTIETSLVRSTPLSVPSASFDTSSNAYCGDTNVRFTSASDELHPQYSHQVAPLDLDSVVCPTIIQATLLFNIAQVKHQGQDYRTASKYHHETLDILTVATVPMTVESLQARASSLDPTLVTNIVLPSLPKKNNGRLRGLTTKSP